MKELLSSLRVAKAKPAYRQISEHIRELVLSGEFPPGTKLPSTQELASLWQAQVTTVQAAMSPLVREGLLVRYPRKGTFVRQREEKLTCVGIFKLAGEGTRSLFFEVLEAVLKDELHRSGLHLEMFVDARREEDRTGPLAALERAISRREIQGLISLTAGPFNYPWLGKLAVPVSYLGGSEPSSVDYDTRQMFELALRALATQGCRSVGLIGGWPSDSVRLYLPFTDLARDLGLTVKNQWMLVPPRGKALTHERYGYQQFDQLWRETERPAGLILDPDSIARGAITRMLELRVEVPRELKLAIHKNELIELLCPMPATFLVSSERKMAQALVAQVQQQFRGEPCEPVSVPYRVEVHRGDSQENQGTR